MRGIVRGDVTVLKTAPRAWTCSTKGRLDEGVRAAGCVSVMMLEPVQAATFDAQAASGPSVMRQVHCTVPLTRPRTDGASAFLGWLRGLLGSAKAVATRFGFVPGQLAQDRLRWRTSGIRGARLPRAAFRPDRTARSIAGTS